jgi:hypothetical protein
MRATPLLTNFTAGELSGKMGARTDHRAYANGCRRLQNFFVWHMGAAERRPGTRFIAEVQNSAQRVRLIPFEYSTEQAYVIEAGPGYFRFFKDGGRIESPPGSPVEVATPYGAADLAQLTWCQSADVLYLFCTSRLPHKLSRTAHTAWSLAGVPFFDGPWLEENTNGALTLAPSATTGLGITITASWPAFVPTDAGRLVRLKHGATWGYAQCSAYVSPTQMTANVGVPFGGTAATGAWRMGLWSDSTGFPAAGTFHEERLVMGGARVRPQRIDGSKSNDFENFAPGTADSDAIAYNIGANQVSAIRWLESWRQLLIGTPSGQFKLGSENAQAGLTPTNVLVRRESGVGSAAIMPRVIGNALVFVARQGRRLYEMVYALEDDGYAAGDLTLFADHLTLGGVAEIAWQPEPAGILWAARADGLLIGCTYLRPQQVVAWHRHPLGGGGAVESLAVIPGALSDELWLSVRRTIQGQTRRYIERLAAPFGDETALAEAWFVDSALDWSGAPATVFAGLDHLEGQSVDILADGAVHPPRTVAGGAITLDYPAARVIAGLGYVSLLETMPLEAGQAEGTAQSRKRRIDKVMVRLRRSLGGEMGVREDQLDALPFRHAGDAMDQPPPLFDGDRVIRPGGSYDDVTVIVRQAQPLPLTVVGLSPRVAAND